MALEGEGKSKWRNIQDTGETMIPELPLGEVAFPLQPLILLSSGVWGKLERAEDHL